MQQVEFALQLPSFERQVVQGLLLHIAVAHWESPVQESPFGLRLHAPLEQKFEQQSALERQLSAVALQLEHAPPVQRRPEQQLESALHAPPEFRQLVQVLVVALQELEQQFTLEEHEFPLLLQPHAPPVQ